MMIGIQTSGTRYQGVTVIASSISDLNNRIERFTGRLTHSQYRSLRDATCPRIGAFQSIKFWKKILSSSVSFSDPVGECLTSISVNLRQIARVVDSSNYFLYLLDLQICS